MCPKKYNIVVLRGDSISKEVIPEAVKALEATKDVVKGLDFKFTEFECGFEYYQKTGEPWPADAYPACKKSDAILFGDIISDLTSTFQGGLGVAPSAEVGDRYGMFRPIHGSAPKYYGQNVANPIATILSAKMLMEWLAQMHNDQSAKEAADRIGKAVDLTLEAGKVVPRDLGGNSKTSEVGEEIAKKIRSL